MKLLVGVHRYFSCAWSVFGSVILNLHRPVFTHGPPAANFQGRQIKKIEIELWYVGKKKAVHEREI